LQHPNGSDPNVHRAQQGPSTSANGSVAERLFRPPVDVIDNRDLLTPGGLLMEVSLDGNE